MELDSRVADQTKAWAAEQNTELAQRRDRQKGDDLAALEYLEQYVSIEGNDR